MLKWLKTVCGILIILLIATVPLCLSYAYDKEKPENRMQLINTENEFSYVRIRTFGTAQGMYYDSREGWRVRQGTFDQEGSGFVVKNGYILTAAHVVVPDIAYTVSGKYSTDVRQLFKVLKQIILIYHFSDTPFVATIHYLNAEYDIAILRCDDGKGILMPLPYPIEFKGTGIHREFNSIGVCADDVVCTVVHDRTEDGDLSMNVHLEYGTVTAAEPTGDDNQSIAWFNPWDITINLPIISGDSGSPLFAFEDGKPIIIGIVRAVKYTEPKFSYAVLLPMVDRYLVLP